MVKNILLEANKNKCCNYVFANSITQTRYADLKRPFTPLCKKANINDFRFHDLRFHDLRHTLNARMIGLSVSIKILTIYWACRYTHHSEIYQCHNRTITRCYGNFIKSR